MDADSFPEVSLSLLEALEGLYPEKPVMPNQGINELMHYGGQRTLVKWLREVYTAQTAPPDEVEQEADQEEA
jgi:hypothetical protein